MFGKLLHTPKPTDPKKPEPPKKEPTPTPQQHKDYQAKHDAEMFFKEPATAASMTQRYFNQMPPLKLDDYCHEMEVKKARDEDISQALHSLDLLSADEPITV